MLKQLYFCHLNPNFLLWVEESLDPQAEAEVQTVAVKVFYSTKMTRETN